MWLCQTYNNETASTSPCCQTHFCAMLCLAKGSASQSLNLWIHYRNLWSLSPSSVNKPHRLKITAYFTDEVWLTSKFQIGLIWRWSSSKWFPDQQLQTLLKKQPNSLLFITSPPPAKAKHAPDTWAHTCIADVLLWCISQTDVVRSNSSASGQCQNLVNVPHRCKDSLNGVTEHFGRGGWEKLLPYSPFCFIKVLHKTLCSKSSRQLYCTHFYIYIFIYI